MSEQKPPHRAVAKEPAMPEESMQEIIASISRIFDEDARTSTPQQIPSRDKGAILELTEAIEDDGSLQKLTTSAPPQSHLADPAQPDTAKEPAPVPSPADKAGFVAASGTLDANLVSATTSAAAIAAFRRLAAAAASETRVDSGPPLSPGGRTLEDVVRDALRPLLQAWLDEHLPGMVERLVLEEIQRLVREARLR